MRPGLPGFAIKLADLIDGVGVGVPYIDARTQACDFSCDAAQCVLACPDRLADLPQAGLHAGAPRRRSLPNRSPIAKEKDPEPTLNLNERMGIARLTRPETCPATRARSGPDTRPRLQGHHALHEYDRWKPIKIADLTPTTCPNATLRPRMPDQGRHLHRNRLRPRRQQAQVACRP